MKVKQKATRRDAIALVALATAALLVILIFFTPPVLSQDNWVRPGDEDRRVQALDFVISKGILQQVRYTVQRSDGIMEQLYRMEAGQEYDVTVDTRTQAGGSRLTMEQAAELLQPLWEMAAQDRWNNATAFFVPPNRVKESADIRQRVNLQLSISTGRAVAVGYDAAKADYGVMQISAFNDTATEGMSLFVQIVP